MRSRLAQIATWVVAWLVVGPALLAQQSVASQPSPPDSGDPCQPFDPPELPSGPEIAIDEVSFEGFLQMPVSDREQVADTIKHETYGPSLKDTIEEVLEKTKEGWQDRGYFKVEATAGTRILTRSRVRQSIAVNIHVEEGRQYHLGKVTFRNNKVLTNSEALRNLFPIKDGDIFSRKQIAGGLGNLWKVYASLGYINVTPIPYTSVDEERRLISFDIDVDEGRQFYLTRAEILGLNEVDQEEILKDAPTGQIYNQKSFELFIGRHPSITELLHREPERIVTRLDERTGSVVVLLDTRYCPDD